MGPWGRGFARGRGGVAGERPSPHRQVPAARRQTPRTRRRPTHANTDPTKLYTQAHAPARTDELRVVLGEQPLGVGGRRDSCAQRLGKGQQLGAVVPVWGGGVGCQARGHLKRLGLAIGLPLLAVHAQPPSRAGTANPRHSPRRRGLVRFPPHLARRPTTITGRCLSSSHSAAAAAATSTLAASKGRAGRGKASSGAPRGPKEGWGRRATSLPAGLGLLGNWVGGRLLVGTQAGIPTLRPATTVCPLFLLLPLPPLPLPLPTPTCRPPAAPASCAPAPWPAPCR